MNKQAKTDAFFIQEIINDLHKNNFVIGGKADTLLKDWSAELREKSHLNGKRKKKFLEEVGDHY